MDALVALDVEGVLGKIKEGEVMHPLGRDEQFCEIRKVIEIL